MCLVLHRAIPVLVEKKKANLKGQYLRLSSRAKKVFGIITMCASRKFLIHTWSTSSKNYSILDMLPQSGVQNQHKIFSLGSSCRCQQECLQRFERLGIESQNARPLIFCSFNSLNYRIYKAYKKIFYCVLCVLGCMDIYHIPKILS